MVILLTTGVTLIIMELIITVPKIATPKEQK